MSGRQPTCLLLLAAGAAWEETALRAVTPGSGVVVVKRCVDVHDLLATASAGQADVAVIAAAADGLDRAAIDLLHHAGVAAVVVVPTGSDPATEQGRRVGVDHVLAEEQVGELPMQVRGLQVAAVAPSDSLRDASVPPAAPLRAAGSAPAVVVWGPTGAPGRTTVALGIAGAMAARGLDPLLLDLDPAAGTVAQHLGVLDDVSGLLASSRHLAAGDLTSSFISLQRRAAGLRLLTGLPRADRWTEVSLGLAEELLTLGRRQGPVVADVGWCIEEDRAAEQIGRGGRHDLTRDALQEADVVVVVGSADPVGLTRLARALTELRSFGVNRAPHVVVNRMRRSLGWEPGQVTDLLGRFGPVHGISFLPEARATLDRALVTGRGVAELGDSELRSGFDALLDDLLPGAPGGSASRRLRRRRAVPARPR